MKKIIFSIALLTTSGFSDMIKLEAGGGSLLNIENKGQYQFSGTMNQFDTVNFEKKISESYYLYADIEHFVPLVPNARIEYYDTKTKGKTSENITFSGSSFFPDSLNNVEYRSLEGILYYSLPLPVVDIDFGAGVNEITGSLSLSDGVQTSTKSYSKTIPFLYGNVQLNIPTTNIGLEANIKYNKSTITDTEFIESLLKVTYSLSDLNLVAAKYKVNLEAGVKNTNQKFIVDGLSMNYKDTNGFIGLNVVFGSL